jgi:hypothetical protein
MGIEKTTAGTSDRGWFKKHTQTNVKVLSRGGQLLLAKLNPLPPDDFTSRAPNSFFGEQSPSHPAALLVSDHAGSFFGFFLSLFSFSCKAVCPFDVLLKIIFSPRGDPREMYDTCFDEANGISGRRYSDVKLSLDRRIVE